MGTNYYLETEVCPHCHRSAERLHIGKSSAGWCFSLHVDAEISINSLDDWRERWSAPRSRIVDEYGRQYTPQEMVDCITKRHRERSPTPGYYPSWDEFHRRNSSEDGPNGMIRSRIDGLRCVGHGDGTYDLIVGEFS